MDRSNYYIDNFAATPEELTMIRPEGCSDTAVYIQLLQLRGRRDEQAQYRRAIMEECSKTESDIEKELNYLQSLEPSFKIDLEEYYKYGAYSLDVLNDKEAAVSWIDNLKRYHVLCDYITQKSDIEQMPFSTFEKEFEEARVLLSKMLSDSRKRELIERMKEIRPDFLEDPAEFDKVAVDMELSSGALGFEPDEYVLFRLWDKSVQERLQYISDRIRKKAGQLLNSVEGRETLNNKYLTYEALKPLYGRSIRQMDGDKGFSSFEEAFRENPVLVKKNNCQSLGKETEKIEVTRTTDLHALYERLSLNGRYFILEDLIIPHPELKRLNPDSINTIRIMAIMEDKEPLVLDTFLRVGRRGSFVDNIRKGGIIVHVDRTKGIVDSHGISESGFVHEKHPDHGYPFLGISIPFWEKALKTVREASRMIPGARYVGWDITCTNENEWIVVEGNSMPMYTGIGIGRERREFLEKIHYNELI